MSFFREVTILNDAILSLEEEEPIEAGEKQSNETLT